MAVGSFSKIDEVINRLLSTSKTTRNFSSVMAFGANFRGRGRGRKNFRGRGSRNNHYYKYKNDYNHRSRGNNNNRGNRRGRGNKHYFNDRNIRHLETESKNGNAPGTAGSY